MNEIVKIFTNIPRFENCEKEYAPSASVFPILNEVQDSKTSDRDEDIDQHRVGQAIKRFLLHWKCNLVMVWYE